VYFAKSLADTWSTGDTARKSAPAVIWHARPSVRRASTRMVSGNFKCERADCF